MNRSTSDMVYLVFTVEDHTNSRSLKAIFRSRDEAKTFLERAKKHESGDSWEIQEWNVQKPCTKCEMENINDPRCTQLTHTCGK